MSQLRVFGDPAKVRSKLRKVIKRGQAILDELEGGRQRTKPDADSAGNALFSHTAVYQGERAMRDWHQSITFLLTLHVPSLKADFDRSLPEPRRGLPSLELLDSFDTYIRGTVKELEIVLERVVKEGGHTPQG